MYANFILLILMNFHILDLSQFYIIYIAINCKDTYNIFKVETSEYFDPISELIGSIIYLYI